MGDTFTTYAGVSVIFLGALAATTSDNRSEVATSVGIIMLGTALYVVGISI